MYIYIYGVFRVLDFTSGDAQLGEGFICDVDVTHALCPFEDAHNGSALWSTAFDVIFGISGPF